MRDCSNGIVSPSDMYFATSSSRVARQGGQRLQAGEAKRKAVPAVSSPRFDVDCGGDEGREREHFERALSIDQLSLGGAGVGDPHLAEGTVDELLVRPFREHAMGAEGTDGLSAETKESLAALEESAAGLHHVIDEHAVLALRAAFLDCDLPRLARPDLHADDGVEVLEGTRVAQKRSLIRECDGPRGGTPELRQFLFQERDCTFQHRHDVIAEVETLLQRVDVVDDQVHRPSPAGGHSGEDAGEGARGRDLSLLIDALHGTDWEEREENLDALRSVLLKAA
mmetsp:Transcript_27411/g.65026  ORF Transcript_27411/g.65026 Transcript_27411/m.65026 type:complete len:282 (+) Transcript_27411:1328-2173(+)